MRRLSALPAAALLVLALAAIASAAGPPFPTPVPGQAVYDGPGALQSETVATLEGEVDQIEARSGAEIAIFVRVDPTATAESNQAAAKQLMDQWGVGRAGRDDGLVILLGLQPDLQHGKISLYAGSGFKSAYLDERGMADVIEQDFTPLAANGDLDGAMRSMLAAIDRSVVPGSRDRLELARLIDALLGLVVAPIALLGTLALALLGWRRQGRDPFFLDSPSILMAGPPADLTPPLATVVRNGRSDQRSVTTALMELASRKLIAFRDMEAAGNGGPSIDVVSAEGGDDSLAEPERYLLRVLRAMAGPLASLDREALSRLHESLGDFHQLLETDAVRLGWFREQPRRAIGRWMAIGVVELLAGGGSLAAGLIVPIAGATALGVALLVGGIATLILAMSMSQRTPAGAMVDGMLRAYRRTLDLTMAKAQSMEQVVADQTVRLLANTPDKAVVWGIALGLHRQVASLLERSLAEQAAAQTSGVSSTAWYPTWLGSAGFGASGAGSQGGGSLFSASPIPNVAGMFATLGTIGAAPASSGGGSNGGGFSGGSSSGGGGASGSF
jgi:uncharacterized membrane protein YgcG